jgi:hypothetical protein
MRTPSPQLPEYFFIQSGLSTPDNTLGLVVNGGSAPNTPVVSSLWQGGLANELWQIQGDC